MNQQHLQPTIKKLLFRWLPALIVMTVIFVMSNTPGTQVSQNSSPITDPLRVVQYKTTLFSCLPPIRWLKVGHIAGYAVLGLALYRGFALSGIGNEFYPTLVSFGYACSDELHQNFVPGRSGAFSDILLDTAAAFAAVVLYLYLKQFFQIKKGIS